MSNAVLDRLVEERASAIEFVDGLLSQAAEEGRDLVETEQRSLDTYRQRITQIDEQMKPIVEFEETRNSAIQIDKRLQSARTPARTAPRPVQLQQAQHDAGLFQGRSFGERITNSDAYAELRGALPGFRTQIEGTASDLALQTRAVIVESAAPGKNLLPEPYRYAAPSAELLTPLLARIQRIPVSTNSVDVVTYGDYITGADVVDEADDKPEGTMTSAVANLSLEKIAVWVQYSREIAQDVPAFQAMVNSQMTRGVLHKLEEQVTTVLAAATGNTTGTAGQSELEVVRVAMAKLEAAGFRPDVLLGPPSLMAAIDLSILGLGGAAGTLLNGGTWGLAKVPVAGLTGLFVADASAAMALFERTPVETFVTDSDIIGAGATAKSAFRANVLTMVTEIRAKAAVLNQAAISKVTVTP